MLGVVVALPGHEVVRVAGHMPTRWFISDFRAIRYYDERPVPGSPAPAPPDPAKREMPSTPARRPIPKLKR